MMLKRKTSGFTMIEIVIVIILVGIIGSPGRDHALSRV